MYLLSVAKGSSWKVIGDGRIPPEGSKAGEPLWTILEASSKVGRDIHVTLSKILGECFGNALLLQWTESLKLQEWLQGCLWNSIGDRKYSGAEIVLETTYALGCSQEPQGCCCWFICLFLSSAPFWSLCGLASIAYSQRPPPYNITHRGSLLLHPLFNSSFLNFSFYYWLILLAFS